MPKSRSQFICQQCAASFSKWTGRCENCGEWNTLVEQTAEQGSSAVSKAKNSGKALTVQSIKTIPASSNVKRIATGMRDLDDGPTTAGQRAKEK